MDGRGTLNTAVVSSVLEGCHREAAAAHLIGNAYNHDDEKKKITNIEVSACGRWVKRAQEKEWREIGGCIALDFCDSLRWYNHLRWYNYLPC